MNSPSNCQANQVESDENEKVPRKQRHSAKRRRARNVPEAVLQGAEADELVRILSKSFKGNRFKASGKGVNSPCANERKTHERLDVSSLAQIDCKARQNNLEEDDDIPSTSSKYLERLFQNLKVNNSKSPVQMHIHSELLKAGKIKESGLQVYKLEELEEIQRSKLMESSQSAANRGNASQNPRNVDIKNSTRKKKGVSKSRQGSMNLVNELYKKCSLSVDAKESSSSGECESENSSVEESGRKADDAHSVKPKPSRFRNESKKGGHRGEKTDKVFLYNKRKRKNARATTESFADSEEFDGKEKVFHNSNLNSARRGNRSVPPGSPSASGKSSKFNWLPQNNKYPKFLTKDEIEKISDIGLLFSGTIRINQKNVNEAYVSAPDKGKDILIRGLFDRNRALEGDEVYYVLKDKKSKPDAQNAGKNDSREVQRKAVVVAIKHRNHNRCAIGIVRMTAHGTCAMFSPRDLRIPKIRLKQKYWPKESCGNLLVYAKINYWDDIRYANGVIIKPVGAIGDIDAETSGIMLTYELEEKPYPAHLSSYFPALPYAIPDSEISRRLDLRKECIFTIDPATAKDLDDALSFKRLDNGNYQVGVHISDVTYFLHDDTPLDSAVCDRATSVYLVQKVYHMLPRELCELCSLTPGEDKLSFSVVWEFTPEFNVVDCYFARSVINSCCQLSYEHAQRVMDGCEDLELPEIRGGHGEREVADAILGLHRIALHLRKNRFDNGALRIDQTKIIFSLDEFGLPTDYFVFVHRDSHRLVEEFMLLANMAVADRISSCYPKIAFLRCHSPPSSYMLKKIKENLEKYGISLDISSSKSLNSSLLEHGGSDAESLSRIMVLNALLAKPMARAKYFCSDTYPNEEDRKHYALNVSLYTHFTSPIRRYADVMVHRLLAASLGYRKPPSWTPDMVQKVAANCNSKKYAAKLAGEKSTELYLTTYIIQRAPFVCKAVVCEIKDQYFDFILLDNGAHQRFYHKDFKGKTSVKVENGVPSLTLRWPKEGNEEERIKVVKVFSIIDVELSKHSEFRLSSKIL